MNQRAFLLRVAILLAALCAAAPAVRAEDVAAAKLTIRVSASRAYDSLAIARSFGDFEKSLAAQQISVKWVGPFPAMAPQIEAMAAGELDFGTGSSTAFATAVAAGAPVTVFGYSREAPGYEGILVPAESKLTSIADFVGKSVAVNRAGTGEYLLLKALEQAHIAENSVKRVFMSPNDAAAAFALGNVDAWATWDPFNSLAQDKYHAKLLVPATDIGSDNQILMVVQSDFLKQHPEVTREVLRLLRVSDDRAIADPEEAGKRWSETFKMPLSVGRLLAAHSSNPLTAVGPKERDELIRTAEWMYAHKMLAKLPDVRPQIVDLSGVK